MPTNKRRTTRVSQGGPLTGRQIEHLLRGWCLGVCEGPDLHFPFRDDAHRRELWFEYKDYLLSLEGRVPGVFGIIKKEKPEAMKDYERKQHKNRP
jgi:hypothetical protein